MKLKKFVPQVFETLKISFEGQTLEDYIKSVAEEQINDQFLNFPEASRPNLEDVEVDLDRFASDTVILKICFKVDYNGFLFDRRCKDSFRFAWPNNHPDPISDSVDLLIPIIKVRIVEICKDAFACDENGILKVEEIIGVNSKSYALLSRRVKAAWTELAPDRDLLNMYNSAILPEIPGFTQAHATLAQLKYTLHKDGKMEITLKLTLSGVMIEVGHAEGFVYRCLICADENLAKKTLLTDVSALVVETLDPIKSPKLYYTMTAPDSISQALYDLLTTGTARIGCVNLAYNGKLKKVSGIYATAHKPWQKLALTSTPPLASDIQSVSFDLQTWEDLRAVSLENLPKANDDFAFGIRFCEKVAIAVEAEANYKNVDSPEVKAFFTPHGFDRMEYSCFSLAKQQTLYWSDRERRDKYKKIAEEVVEEKYQLDHLEENLRDTIADLNPTQYAVLKFIVNKGSSYLSEVTKEVSKLVQTNQQYIASCLSSLERNSVLAGEGKRLPLLSTRSVKGTYGWFDVYRCNIDRLKPILPNISPRPYNRAEAKYLSPKAHESWFIDQMLNSKTPEEQWKTFSDAQDNLPKASLARFLKTEEGQAFFKNFTGDDAMFVKLALEEIPGCKTIVNKLFPEN